jgi:hypothetical protein
MKKPAIDPNHKYPRRVKEYGFLNMRLPRELWAKLNRQANREARTMAHLARTFIKAGLERRASE